MGILWRAFACFVALSLAACAVTSSEQKSAALAPPTRDGADAHPVDLTQGLGFFTARFYRPLAEKAGANDNLFISPVSLSQGLGLAWLGARGQTAAEMRSLLGWPDTFNPAPLTARYNAQLLATGDPKVELCVANALWLADWLPVRREYLDAARQAYAAAPETLAFARAPGAAADRINGWVSDQTRGRIPEIVSAEQFDATTAAVLTNAVYFKGEWQTAFTDGAEGTFTSGDGTRKPIHLMERVGPMQYRETSEGQAVALPYGDQGRFVMEVFLPRDASILRRWEQQLHGLSFFAGEQGSDDRFDLSAVRPRTILLRLPRFEARFRESVNTALIDAGMSCAFRKECADFSGIVPVPMKIDQVAHATFLRVDEQGTEAAAATAVTIVAVGARLAPPSAPRMIVDRPFLVALRDRASGALLFFGRISDPTAVGPPNS